MHGAEDDSHYFTNALRSENNETLNERGILKQFSSDQMRSRYSIHMKFGSANLASMAKQSFQGTSIETESLRCLTKL